ncbi:MAG TPA: DUF6542 domain-containing protein [Blastococcus sp.]|nr:DUF6542 domain-containing protein [Blastococcus sp.]
MATADAWPRSGARPGRASADARPGRPSSADRASRPQSSRRSSEPPLRPRSDIPRSRVEDRYRQSPLEQPRAAARPARERAATSPAQSSPSGRIRGLVAVVGMFLVTLGAAAADSFLGVGLGTLTLVALVAVTALAALVVRRNDIVTVVVAPPLVFLAVAAVNIGLAPSASFNLPTIATLLVRGFPTMGIATAVALVVALARLAARR